MASNFLANVISASIIQANVISIFSQYAQGSFIYWISLEFKYCKMNPHIWNSSAYTYITVIFFVFTLISLIFVGANRIRYTDITAAAKAKKKGEKTKKAKDILTKNLVEANEEIIDF